ncbi:condensation domain-containing protein [Streptomyces olivochromogenes]|uniref:condensation domain-containing protein n=1 Tax=Streptomyces olivochromogenes TaxID=1963 RepID=UPI0036DD33EA
MRRRLSPYERFVWAAGEALPFNIAAIARVHGRADPDRIRESLAAARRRHPLLGVRVTDSGRWRAWLTTDGVPDPQLRVVKATDPDSWARVVEEELQRSFDTAVGPLTRFVVVDAGESFDLISVYHHLVGDAHSAGTVIHDVLRGPADVPSAPAFAPPADTLLTHARPELSDLRKLARSVSGPTRRPHRSGRLTFTTWSLDSDETTALLARCRTERTTLQAALCTAFARALPHSARIAVAADLRRILAPAARTAVGLYATSFIETVNGADPRDFWALARDVRTDIHHRLVPEELSPLVRAYRLLPFIPSQTIGSLLHRSESQGARFDVSISNARLPIPTDYGPLRVSALYGAAHTSLSGAPLVFVAGFDGRLFLSVTSTGATSSKDLCERSMSHLTVACS